MTSKRSRVLDALLSWSCCTWISQQEPAEIFHHYYYLMGFQAFLTELHALLMHINVFHA